MATARLVWSHEKQDAKLDVALPDSLSLSAYHGINPQWAVMADITWTQWSRLNSLVVEFARRLTQRDTRLNGKTAPVMQSVPNTLITGSGFFAAAWHWITHRSRKKPCAPRASRTTTAPG